MTNQNRSRNVSREAPKESKGAKAEAPPTTPDPALSSPPSPLRAKPAEPAPAEFAGQPQDFLSLCNIAGHSWEKKHSPRGQWTFHQCRNAACGKIVEVKPVA